MEKLQVLSRDRCVQCVATKRALRSAGLVEGVHFVFESVESNPELFERARLLGYSQAPVCFGPTGHWGGFDPDAVRGFAEWVWGGVSEVVGGS